jgi:hypothetical protein
MIDYLYRESVSFEAELECKLKRGTNPTNALDVGNGQRLDKREDQEWVLVAEPVEIFGNPRKCFRVTLQRREKMRIRAMQEDADEPP